MLKNVKKVIGKRIFVQKKQLDLGGLQGTPAMEDGEKNEGEIIGVGQIGLRARLRGVRKGAVVLFNKHFAPNFMGEADDKVFVELENVLAILKK